MKISSAEFALPIDDVLPEIIQHLRERTSLVLTASPGAGKTTRVPPALLKSQILLPSANQILLLQPRRVAVRATAERIAREENWELGRDIGYQVRFERVGTGTAPLEILTEGILVRRLQNDPALNGVGLVILDEFHERSLHLDLSIALLKEVQDSLRPDLKILVMSATLDAHITSQYLGNAPVIHAPGRIFPVEVIYAREPLPIMGGSPLQVRVLKVLTEILGRPNVQVGDVLVFLPGAGEIKRLSRALMEDVRFRGVEILELYGQQTSEEQMRVLRKGARQKIILSTNIAETSLTIDGVATVVDCGLARVLEFDARVGVESLQLSRISLASARQREGRAGRQRSGTCYKLWMKSEELSMAPYLVPEVKRVDLTDFILNLAQWGSSPETLNWYEPPDATNLTWSLKILTDWDALERSAFRLTNTGRAMACLSLPARLSRLVVEGSVRYNRPREALDVACLLAERDLLPESTSRDGFLSWDDDLAIRLSLLHEEQSVASPFLKKQVQQLISQISKQVNTAAYATYIKDLQSQKKAKADTLTDVLLSAFPDRVVRRREGRSMKGLIASGRGVIFSDSSVCRRAEYVLALQLFLPRAGTAGEPEITLGVPISLEQLRSEKMNECLERQTITTTVNGKFQRALQLYYREIPLGQARVENLQESEIASALSAVILSNPELHFSKSPNYESWNRRRKFATVHQVDWTWLNFDSAVIENVVESWTLGRKNLSEVYETSVVTYFEAQWTPAEKRLFDQQIPDSILVPSGSRIAIQYDSHRPPTLSVRLQEVFGWTETPTVLNGKVPVVLELLAPNFRPLQVTSDICSFWELVYHEVRGPLRMRYPKHHWPDDPRIATAVLRRPHSKKT